MRTGVGPWEGAFEPHAAMQADSTSHEWDRIMGTPRCLTDRA
jgi:hypothetical protein